MQGKVITALLAAGGDVNKPGEDGQTPLIAAVTHSDHHPGPAIRALLAGGADPHAPCSSGLSFVQQASLDDNVDALPILLELGVHPDTRAAVGNKGYGGASLLDLAARRLSLGAVKLLLSAGANDGITTTGLSPGLIDLAHGPPEATVPADDVRMGADQVRPVLTKSESERRSAAILSMIARAKFVRKDWLAVLRARCDDGTSLTGAGSVVALLRRGKILPGAASASSPASTVSNKRNLCL